VPFRWPDNRLIDLFEIEHPIILAPMAGAIGCRIGGGGVRRAGGLGSLPCNVDAGPDARPVCSNPCQDRQAGQREFFLSRGREMGAAELTKRLAAEAQDQLRRLAVLS